MNTFFKTILLLSIVLITQILLAQSSCASEEPLIEDLNSITKCTIEEVKGAKKRHHKVRKRKRISIVVSSKRNKSRVFKSKTAVSVNTIKLANLKKETALISKLDVSKKEAKIGKLPFTIVEEKPLFSACKDIDKNLQSSCFNKELAKHIKKELQYPKRALLHKMQGRVLVQFTIDYKGDVTNVQVKKTKNNGLLEEEAERIIRKLPKFIPGKVNGAPVYVNKGVPINFVLAEEYKAIKKKYKPLTNVLPMEEADVIAEFPSCKGVESREKMNCFNREMIKHIEANFKYPKSAVEDGVEGRVVTTFVINKKGKVTDIQVKGPKHGFILEKAAIRLLNKLPRLSPSKKDGKLIETKYSIPISFKIL